MKKQITYKHKQSGCTAKKDDSGLRYNVFYPNGASAFQCSPVVIENTSDWENITGKQLITESTQGDRTIITIENPSPHTGMFLHGSVTERWVSDNFIRGILEASDMQVEKDVSTKPMERLNNRILIVIPPLK